MSRDKDFPFTAIAAMALNRVIGDGPRIPWRISEDLKWFKRLTMGNTLIMGRKTYESIGKALPGRRTVVLSRQANNYPDAIGVQQLEEVFDLDTFGDLFICGGGQLYELALPQCARLYLTLVKRQANGDVYFPEFEAEFTPIATLQETPEFEIKEYQRTRATASSRL